MKFPLFLRFKLIALASQIYVEDTNGQTVCYVKQKLFKFKEAISIFRDTTQTELLYKIAADRVIDFRPRFTISAADGSVLGSIKRQGMRSIFKSHYDLFRGENSETPVGVLQEENAWVKVLDHLVSQVPLVGMFSGYFLNPTYIVVDQAGAPIIRIHKMKAFLEGKFKIEQLSVMDDKEVEFYTLAILMMVLMERSRG
jgi:uncharacterized protein YxjI